MGRGDIAIIKPSFQLSHMKQLGITRSKIQRENHSIFISTVSAIHHKKGGGLGINDLFVTLSLKLSEILHKIEIIIWSLERYKYNKIHHHNIFVNF